MTFVQSSMNPSAPLASAVPSTARLTARYSLRIRNGTVIESRIRRPPIVGVPAFSWCPSGPSSRMCWPNSRSRMNSMNFGPRNMQMNSEPIPPMRISPSI